MKTTAVAHAKINLNLHVIGQGDDGYHQLQSIVVFAEVGDQISMQFAKGQQADQLIINGPFASLLNAGTNNLVTAALDLFRQTWPDAVPSPLSVTLTKNLPVASGIGGGSADAAAMLKLLQSLSPMNLSNTELIPLAQKLGSDVPVCLNQHPTLMQGRGEKLTPVSQLPPMFAVLANPLKSVSTQKVFAALTNKQNSELPKFPDKFANMQGLMNWLKTTRNDLASPAIEIVPEIEQIIRFLESQTDCQLARMSGSGATVFGLFQTKQAAKTAADNLGKKWPKYWCVATKILAGPSR